MLEEAEHRRLLEKWVYGGLSAVEEEQLPASVRERVREYFTGLVETAMRDVESGRITDGPTAMKRLRDRIKARHG